MDIMRVKGESPMSTHAAKIIRLIALVLFVFNVSYSQNASICNDSVQAIEHPEEYVIDTVTARVKKDGVSCLLHSNCCLPGWQLDPVCYVVKPVTNRTKVSDAWTEYKKNTTCQDYPIDKALKTLFRDYTKPENAVVRLLGLEPFYKALGSEVALARTTAHPVPDDVQTELIAKLRPLLVRSIYIRTQSGQRIPKLPPEGEPNYYQDSEEFDQEREAIGTAVWLRWNEPGAAALWALKAPSGAHAITFENLIIVGPDMLNATGCARLGYWAHEITHVKQYKNDGLEGFLGPYLVDYINNGYCGINAEIEAYRIENLVRESCGMQKNDACK